MTMKDWLAPGAFPILPPKTVHVWCGSLDVDRETREKFVQVLSATERSRAERFLLERDRNSFIAAHGILRCLLAGYLGCAADAIQFTHGAHGKPAVSDPRLPNPLSFNLSHAHGLAAVAIVRGREIGVDIEKIRPDFAGKEVAKRYFSAAEIAELGRLPEARRAEGFFLCWTRKEAYVKALGEGLHFPLDKFSVSLTPGEPVRLHAEDAIRWSIRSFAPSKISGMTHAGAVVCEGNDWTMQFLDWGGSTAQAENPPVISKR
jgi:4'-phosphopantetheinyl transferase